MRRAHTSPACPVAWLRHRAGAVRVGAVIGCETLRSLGPEAASEPDRQGHRWRSHSSRSEAAPVSAGSRELARLLLFQHGSPLGQRAQCLQKGEHACERNRVSLHSEFRTSTPAMRHPTSPLIRQAFKEDIQMANRYMERCQYC